MRHVDLLGHARGGAGAAPQVRRRARGADQRRRPSSTPRSTARSRGARRRALRAADLHRDARAARAARAPRPGARARGRADERRRRDLARPRVRRLPRRPAATGSSSRGRRAAACSTSAPAPGASRSRWRAPATRWSRSSATRVLAARARAGAPTGLPIEVRCADACDFALEAPVALCDRADADDPPARRPRRVPALRARARCGRGGVLAVALLGEGVEPFELELDADVVQLGARPLRERPDRAAPRRRQPSCSSAAARASPRRRDDAPRLDRDQPARVRRRDARRARRGAPASPPLDARRSRRRASTPAARSSAWRRRRDPARLRALPGPDEHLRRPRQPADARAPLRLARDRAGGCTRARSARSCATSTTSTTSAAARTPTSAAAPAICVEHKAAALHAAAARGAVVLGVCGGYQLLGHSYELGAETIPGIGLLDVHTVRADGPAADRQRRRARPTRA